MKRFHENAQPACLNQPQRKRVKKETNGTNSSLVFSHYQRAGDYNFLENIGRGICGTVYKAEDKRNKRTVAIKMIKYDERFTSIDPMDIREVRILQMIRHENVVKIYDVVKCEESRKIGIVLEYIDFSLPSFMNRIKTRLTEYQVRYLIYQLLCGVKYLHAAGIIHRDLKLGNLLLHRDGQLKITDFGSSCICQTETFSYSSKVDMWSIGCVFALLLLKKPLFDGKNDEDQIEKIFQIIGTPTEMSWPGVTNLPGMQRYLLTSPPSYVGCLWDEFKQRDTSENGLKLLESFLQLDPSKRINAKDAVENEYFKGIFTLHDSTAFAKWMNKKLEEKEVTKN
ncbi:hypothetical protein ACTXT7_015638 [Hymenolepis weldensis]